MEIPWRSLKLYPIRRKQQKLHDFFIANFKFSDCLLPKFDEQAKNDLKHGRTIGPHHVALLNRLVPGSQAVSK